VRTVAQVLRQRALDGVVAENPPKRYNPTRARHVWGTRLPAGTSDREHSHPHEMVYFNTGGKVRIHLPGGESVELEIPDGHAMKHEPWTHRVENIGTTDIKAVLFERSGG